MDFFRLAQDMSYSNAPVLINIRDRYPKTNFCTAKSHLVPEQNIVFISNPSAEYIDILSKQIFLVSEQARDVLKMYQPEMKFKAFCILNNIAGEYHVYYAPIVQYLSDAIHNKKYLTSGEPIRLVRAAVEQYSIFKTENEFSQDVYVRIDLAESLMRRNMTGMQLLRMQFAENIREAGA